LVLATGWPTWITLQTASNKMRSLSLKLTLAFLFVSVVGVVLVAFIVRQRTQSEFDRFVLDRYQVDLLEDLSTYYERNGSWDEFSGIVAHAPARYGRAVAPVPAPVTLTDVRGTVVFGGLQHGVGKSLSTDELNQAVPVEVGDEIVGWVLFADSANPYAEQPESPESRFLDSLNQAVLLGTVIAVAIALLIGVVLARTISRPVREVTKATQIVAAGDLGYQVPVRTKDELGELASSFNKMSVDLDRANRQRRQMTADIAHDLRTPLSVILGYMESLSTGKLEPTPETFEIIYAKGVHLQHLIDDLRILALADAGELTLTVRPTDPAVLLEHAALAYMIHSQQKNIEIRVEITGELPEVEVDPDRMAQVLGNLVSNALHYTPGGGEIILSAERDDDMIRLKVSDDGSGIDAEDIPHIFDRFYRSDMSRQQNGESGLGLAIAKSIVLAHGGTIDVSSAPGKGTAFTIFLPMSQE
jgi:two-component system sensor histidine kinase BaeS